MEMVLSSNDNHQPISKIQEDVEIDQNNPNDNSAEVLNNNPVFCIKSDKTEEKHEEHSEEIMNENSIANMEQVKQLNSDDNKTKNLYNGSKEINIVNDTESNNTSSSKQTNDKETELYDKAATSIKISSDGTSNNKIGNKSYIQHYENYVSYGVKDSDTKNVTASATVDIFDLKNEKQDKAANTNHTTFVWSPKNATIRADSMNMITNSTDTHYDETNMDEINISAKINSITDNKEIINKNNCNEEPLETFRYKVKYTGSIENTQFIEINELSENFNQSLCEKDIALDFKENKFSAIEESVYDNRKNEIYSPEMKSEEELIKNKSEITESLSHHPEQNMNFDKYENASNDDLNHSFQTKLDEEIFIPAFVIMKHKDEGKCDEHNIEVDENAFINVYLKHDGDKSIITLSSGKESEKQTNTSNLKNSKKVRGITSTSSIKNKIIQNLVNNNNFVSINSRNLREFNKAFSENNANKDHTITSNFAKDNTNVDDDKTKNDLKFNESNCAKLENDNMASTSYSVDNTINNIESGLKSSLEISNPKTSDGQSIQNIANIDTDSDYNSSDFEFIDEKDAKTDLLLDKNIDNIQYDFSKIWNRYKYDHRFQTRNSFPGPSNYQNRHIIPIGDDYLKLFRENEYHPVLSNIQLLEKKSTKERNDRFRWHYDVLLIRPENSDDENDEVKATLKKINSMYPSPVNTLNKRRRN